MAPRKRSSTAFGWTDHSRAGLPYARGVRFVTWLLTTAAGVAVATWLFDGIYFTGPDSGSEEFKHKILPLLIVALILGLVSSVVRPVVTFFSIPFIIVTLGLFLLVINALMLMLTAWIAGRSRPRLPCRRVLERTRRLDRDHDRELGDGVRPQGRRLTVLPPPRHPGQYAVALVCLGNICRSPTAQVVLEQRLAEAGLDDRVAVRSGGTAGWHIGKPMDPRSAATLSRAGYDPSRHRARQYAESWADEDDLVLAMDADNLADLGGRSDRVGLFRDHDPVDPGSDGPRPVLRGTDGFAEVLSMVERTSDALVARLAVLLERA